MRKALYIVCLLALTACSSTTAIPIDDAYYWPANESKPASKTTQVAETTQAESMTQESAPQMEIISQQDTTITVRIKK